MKNSFRRALATTTALTIGTGLSLGFASPAFAVPDTWTITSLSLDNAVVVDSAPYSGDDDGFLAAMRSAVMLSGGDSGYNYSLSSLAPIASNSATASDSNISQIADLKSNIAYEITIADNVGIGTISQMVELDQDGNPTTNVIDWSSDFVFPEGDCYLMSGFGFLAIWDVTNGGLTTIAPDGTVTTVTSAGNSLSDFVTVPADHSEGSNWFLGAGVAQFDGTDYWYVGTDSNESISEWNITGSPTTTELLDNIDSQSDSDTFTVSTCSNKWYIHTENNDGDDDWTSFFGEDITGMEEPILAADAVFSGAGTCPETSPELPNTGLESGATIAFASLLVALGATTFIAMRRRGAAE